MKRWLRPICVLLLGHQWKRVGETFIGFEREPRRILWKCERCRLERETHPWMRPTP